jgi:hypothetical protein
MLVVAQQVLQSPELTGQIFSHLRDSRALQRAGLACQRWYLEASRFLWAVRRQLFGLEHQIPAVYQKAIASSIRHLDLSLIDQLWEGSPSFMPVLVGLQTAILDTKALHHQCGAQCLQKMLVGSLRGLCIDTSTDDDLGSLESDTCWFRTLSLNCTNLVALSLDAQLSASARDQLELVLLGTRLGRLTLGRLLDDTLDDWGLALILAQESMITLELDRPTTETTFEVLEQQCNGLHALKKLQAMKVSIDVSHEEVFASLLSVTPSLAVLHATLHHTGEISPWCPTPAMFNAVDKLRRLSHLDMILHCHHPFGLQNYAAITSADLLALLECPLKTFNISAYKSEQEYMLGL